MFSLFLESTFCSSFSVHFMIIDSLFADKVNEFTLVLDESLDFNNNLLNLPLPASEKMNSLVILYLEVSYITLLIFFIVSFILLETLLVHSSFE
jgi:hypothetical protein